MLNILNKKIIKILILMFFVFGFFISTTEKSYAQIAGANPFSIVNYLLIGGAETGIKVREANGVLDKISVGIEGLTSMLSPKRLVPQVLVALDLFGLKTTLGILVISGKFLDYIIQLTVVDMVTAVESIKGLDIAWRAIRDFVNLFVIFFLLKNAIMVILNLDQASSWRKTLFNLILATIFMNFSMLMTKVMIDASNVVSVGLYNQIQKTQNINKDGVVIGEGITPLILDKLKIQTVFDVDQLEKTSGTFLSSVGESLTAIIPLLIVQLIGSIFAIVSSIIFLLTSFIFIHRFIVIIFLIPFSSIAFASMLLPELSELSNKWWKLLKNALLFAPKYMLMLWVAFKILDDPGFISTTKINKANIISLVISPDKETLSTIFSFALMIGILYFAVKMASEESKTAVSWTNKFQNWIGSRTIGAGAYFAKTSIKGSDFFKKNPRMASALVGGFEKLSKAKFTIPTTNAKDAKSYEEVVKADKTKAEKMLKEMKTDEDKAALAKNLQRGPILGMVSEVAGLAAKPITAAVVKAVDKIPENIKTKVGEAAAKSMAIQKVKNAGATVINSTASIAGVLLGSTGEKEAAADIEKKLKEGKDKTTLSELKKERDALWALPALIDIRENIMKQSEKKDSINDAIKTFDAPINAITARLAAEKAKLLPSTTNPAARTNIENAIKDIERELEKKTLERDKKIAERDSAQKALENAQKNLVLLENKDDRLAQVNEEIEKLNKTVGKKEEARREKIADALASLGDDNKPEKDKSESGDRGGYSGDGEKGGGTGGGGGSGGGART